jgi:hypothetical protein
MPRLAMTSYYRAHNGNEFNIKVIKAYALFPNNRYLLKKVEYLIDFLSQRFQLRLIRRNKS